jgi:hypothetical protein
MSLHASPRIFIWSTTESTLTFTTARTLSLRSSRRLTPSSKRGSGNSRTSSILVAIEQNEIQISTQGFSCVVPGMEESCCANGSEFATSLPVPGCCARGTAKRLREMALIGETCLDRDKRNGFLAMQEKFLCAFNPGVNKPLIRRHSG